MTNVLVRNFSISLDGYGAGRLKTSNIRSELEATCSTNGYLPPAAGGR